LKLQLRKPLVFFDLETTGLSIATDKIVELCFIKLMPNGERKTLYKKINPGIPIPLEVSLLHGIYDKDVEGCPKFNEIAKNLAQFIEGCDLAGFNIMKFDLPMLTEEFLKCNIDFNTSNRQFVDAQKIYHLMEPRNLKAAYQFYCSKSLDSAHTAEADTEATVEVLLAQIEKYDGVVIKDVYGKESIPVKGEVSDLHKLTLSNNIDFASRFVYNAQGVAVVNFGKHKDKPVEWVLKNEPSYYDWFMKGDFTLDSKRKFTEMKIKMMTQK
jgi:DNA polymerase-3 subunit epsilon